MQPSIAKAVSTLQIHSSLAETAAKLFYWAAVEQQPAIFLSQSLLLVSLALGSDYLALAMGEKGIWRTLGASGPQRALPTDLLAESLDADAPIQRGDWYVAPFIPRSGSGEML